MTRVAILVAAGSGTRMGADMPKALIPIAGRPLLAWSMLVLRRSALIDAVIVVAPPGHERPTEIALGVEADGATVIVGGSSRAESVLRGLRAMPEGVDQVVVHDAARPLVSDDHLRMAIDGISGGDGAIVAAPAADTIKRCDADMAIAETLDRAVLWLAQTPQAFRATSLLHAFEQAERRGDLDRSTDCASLVEAVGGRVRVVPSSLPNQKVTTPADLEVVAGLLAAREERGH